ncbi:YbjN domain-containing protein [Candidatus Kaiserbacteria bacterium]|nr:YbjN domain-containing protein [Candidatus Kaiserbacteria bacterium]
MAQSTGVSQRTSPVPHPLDIVEKLVEIQDWMFERRGDDEIAVQVPGMWCEYSLFFAWHSELEAMHFSCAFDIRVPPDRRACVNELIILINNEMVWMGHFILWSDDGLPMFRHAMSFRGTKGPTREQVEDIVDTAIRNCEGLFPAFQYVTWSGMTAKEAIAAAMINTEGEA